MRLHKHFEKQQAALRVAGVNRCPAFRVTPGMLAELRAEAMAPITHIMTCQGQHALSLIETPTRATGHNVILAPREDLFVESDSDVGIQMVSLENDVTAIPDNIACVEVISVGPLVQNVEVGQLAFIDFFDVKQGYVLDNEELYIAGCEAFKAKFDSARQRLIPLANYMTTRHAPERFKVALTGTDRVHLPDYVTTSGIAGGKTSTGQTSTEVLYQEVVEVGPMLGSGFPGLMTRLERSILDSLADPGQDLSLGALRSALIAERTKGRPADVKPGELVVFCRDVATKLRVRGEFQHLLPVSAALAVIDDEALLNASIRKGRAGKLQLVG